MIKKSELPNTSPVSLYILKASSPSITKASEDASSLKFLSPMLAERKTAIIKAITRTGFFRIN
jgi:hypothetical protein